MLVHLWMTNPKRLSERSRERKQLDREGGGGGPVHCFRSEGRRTIHAVLNNALAW